MNFNNLNLKIVLDNSKTTVKNRKTSIGRHSQT
jgi:hypothetical protein